MEVSEVRVEPATRSGVATW